MAGLDYLGNKELLDPKRYEWISRNLPAVKNAEVFTDNNCTFYKIYFCEDGKDLMLRPDDRSTLKDIHTLLYQCCKAAKSRRRLHLNELHKLQNIKKEIEAYAGRATNKA